MKKLEVITKLNEMKLKTTATITGVSTTLFYFSTRVMQVSADTGTPGFDLDKAKEVTDGYTEPLKAYFLYIIPAVAIIGASIMGVKYFFKKEQEREDYDIYGKLINMGLVASVLQALVVFLRIFGVV